MTPTQLERYAFLWSEARLCIAAVALFLNGVPPVRYLLPTIPLVGIGLVLAWIISGIASCYLFYRYVKHGQKLFGRSDIYDRIAFWIMVVSGFNLGITGLVGYNIGMHITHNYIVFLIVGVVYLLSGMQLYRRFKTHGARLF